MVRVRVEQSRRGDERLRGGPTIATVVQPKLAARSARRVTDCPADSQRKDCVNGGGHTQNRTVGDACLSLAKQHSAWRRSIRTKRGRGCGLPR